MKRGISPIIATVLLLFLSIALGAVVMTFTESSTRDLTDNVAIHIDTSYKCTLDSSLKVVEIQNSPQMCYNRSGSDNFEVIIENQGKSEVKGVRIFLIDSNDKLKQQNIIIPITAHSRTRYNIDISQTDDGSVFKLPPLLVKISPIHSAGDKLIVCSNKEIEVEEIEACDEI